MELAHEFGVAPMTVRSVLANLEADGLVARQPGRGTFVLPAVHGGVLVLAQRAPTRQVVAAADRSGLVSSDARNHEAVLEQLHADTGVVAVVVQIRARSNAQDLELVRSVRRRWPTLTLMVITSDPGALAPLGGTPEWPVFVLVWPFSVQQIEELLRMALSAAPRTSGPTFSDFLEAVPQAALIVKASTGEILSSNNAAEQLMGSPPSPAAAEVVSAFVNRTSRAHKGPAANEIALPGPEGQQRWVQLANGQLGRDTELVVLHDRTAEHGAERWLTFHTQMLEAVEQAVVATDPLGYILYWNRGAEKLYGWRRHEVLGKNLGDVIVAPELLQVGRKIMAELRQGRTWAGEFPVERRDRTVIRVQVTDSPIRDPGGELIGIIGVAVDVSDRKQAELDHLERERLELELAAAETRLSELRGTLAATIPELEGVARNPLLPTGLRRTLGNTLEQLRALVPSSSSTRPMPPIV